MADELRFDVVVQGRPVAGRNAAEVRQALARLMKIPEEKAARLLEGRPARVVRGVDRPTAEKYRLALVGAGAEAAIEAHQATPATQSSPAAMSRDPVAGDGRRAGGATVVQRRPMAPRPQPAARRFPVVPAAAVSLGLAVAVLILVTLTGHSDPPRHQLLELANDMVSDVLRVHRVMTTSSTYIKLSGRDRDDSKAPGLSGGQFMIAIEESFRQTSGQASLTTTIQKDVDASRISASVNEARSSIRRRLAELDDGTDEYSDEYAAACSELKGLFTNYDQLIDVGLHPSRQADLAGFLAAYDMGRTFITMEYMGVVSTIHALDAGDAADEEFFTSAHQEALRLGDELKQAIK